MDNGSSLHWRGFTLIELIVVVLILSVLAATALPRFLNISDQAHTSAVKGVTGGFSSAVSSVRAQWIAEGGTGNTVNLSGTIVPVSTDGWPTPLAGTTNCIDLWDDLMQNPPSAIPLVSPLVSGDGFWAWTVTNATASMCLYIYRPTYPDKLMWIVYYADNTTSPQLNGRIVKTGF